MQNHTQAHTPLRIVTAASLFDGHDAAINLIRRLLQASGAEVIHLGHNRSVHEIVTCALQEDAHAIAISSYQGGHTEYLRYMYDLLAQQQASHIRIFAGGGGVILPHEIDELHRYGIERIYSPDDGRALGLQGMIDDLIHRLQQCPRPELPLSATELAQGQVRAMARTLSAIENQRPQLDDFCAQVAQLAAQRATPVVGITGTGGAGKSSLVDELVRRFLTQYEQLRIAILSIDPTKRRSGGALLGDRIRMNAIDSPRVFMRSLATRQANLSVARHMADSIKVVRAAGFDLILLETSGIGQSDTQVVELSDLTLYVMTPEYGAATQLEKIDMLDYAHLVALNKSDKRGAADALRDVKKQYQRNHQRFDQPADQMPVFATRAAQFNDAGVDALYAALVGLLQLHFGPVWQSPPARTEAERRSPYILPPQRVRYLSEIADTVRQYNHWAQSQSQLAAKVQSIRQTLNLAPEHLTAPLEELYQQHATGLHPDNLQLLQQWPQIRARYQAQNFEYTVRGQVLCADTAYTSLSGIRLPKVALPRTEAWADILRWQLLENLPGEFPYAAGVFPFKRQGEDPTRMFAGEGGPERTNKRFHYVSLGMPAKRLSTAFDSVTLYGNNPALRPDIYGKVGNAGVSIACLDDAKKLYSGFDLLHPQTSVSMTINGPAPILTAFFLNAAIDQQCELYIRAHQLEAQVEARIQQLYAQHPRPSYQGPLPEGNNGLGLMLLGVTGDQVLPRDVYQHLRQRTLQAVRGTVQADILKEDQAQNTCIFSTDFSLQLMGDVQQYFIDHNVRNFYSVSISGYHIAEAGANPVTQLAFTLANGFTYVEYYLARGMHIDAFAPNLSFFFSNGTDPEYAVLGRVARIVWAKAMKLKYGGNDRSQKLKYHIQTSGRSLHAQEIDFNDIRTTLQALYALYDNCNSLHTNAYDEAITTPTEESVRRAMAIQLIINRELGLAKNENPLQGAFVIEELTELVEEAVLAEFDRLTERGGVLGAMETMYQRGKIQDESMHYEHLKHSGELPIVGVNTFLSAQGSPTVIPSEVIRATEAEKQQQIDMLERLHSYHGQASGPALQQLKATALRGDNLFAELMETVKTCSLGQITQALFEVGGQYRRNM